MGDTVYSKCTQIPLPKTQNAESGESGHKNNERFRLITILYSIIDGSKCSESQDWYPCFYV